MRPGPFRPARLVMRVRDRVVECLAMRARLVPPVGGDGCRTGRFGMERRGELISRWRRKTNRGPAAESPACRIELAGYL